MSPQRMRELRHQEEKGRRMGIPAAADLGECLDEIATLTARVARLEYALIEISKLTSEFKEKLEACL